MDINKDISIVSKACANKNAELSLAWYRIRAKLVEGQKPSTNSDYAMALAVYDEYMEHETTSRYSLHNFREWLKQRLHSNTNVA